MKKKFTTALVKWKNSAVKKSNGKYNHNIDQRLIRYI